MTFTCHKILIIKIVDSPNYQGVDTNLKICNVMKKLIFSCILVTYDTILNLVVGPNKL